MNERICLLRKSHGLSQLQLAQILHISASAEGMYEQGRRTPSLETLIAMAMLFHVSLDYLITGSEFAEESAPYTKGSASSSFGCGCCCCKRSGAR